MRASNWEYARFSKACHEAIVCGARRAPCLRGRHVGSRTRRCHTHQLVAKSSRTHGFAAASSVLPAPTARRHHTCAIRSTRGETSSAAAVPETRRRRHAGREDANLHTHGRRLRAPPNLATRGAARRVAAATCLERHALAARQGDLDADLAPAQLPHCFRVNTTFCMEKKWAGALASRCRLIEGNTLRPYNQWYTSVLEWGRGSATSFLSNHSRLTHYHVRVLSRRNRERDTTQALDQRAHSGDTVSVSHPG